MSKDLEMVYGRNHKGYPDPTAATALANIERQIRGKQIRVAGGHFEAIIEASLEWYKERGTAHIEKTPEPMTMPTTMQMAVNSP